MTDADTYRAKCVECNEVSDNTRFGTAIAWKVAHGLETGHVDVDVAPLDEEKARS